MKRRGIQTAVLMATLLFSAGFTTEAQLGKNLVDRAKSSLTNSTRQATKLAVNKAANPGHEGTRQAMPTGSQSTAVPQGNGKTYYVNANGGSNRNDGSKTSPLKNIQKAIDIASDGATIMVAEGNYYGLLKSGNITVSKAVTIMGGYSSDFSSRDILQHQTLIQPTPESNGSAKGRGTMFITVKNGGQVVLDGLIFDRGNSIAYNMKGEGRPEGVESPMMQPIGVEGIGGADMKTRVKTVESSILYLDNPVCDLTVQNCAFVNCPNYAILGLYRGKAKIDNNIFINVRMATCDIRGSDAQKNSVVEFSNNTVLFIWSRLRDLATMGYGYRYIPGVDNYIHHNIIGLTTFAGLDRTHVDSNKEREARRITTAEHNIFFLNKQTDLTLPGGGMFLRVQVEDFEDVEELDKVEGNKRLTDPSIFKGKIDEAYLNGFLAASYKETTDYDPNSAANTFRSAMGMNTVGKIDAKTSMYANRYNLQKALNLFGAVNGYGAQRP